MSSLHQNASPSRENAPKESATPSFEGSMRSATRPGDNQQHVQLAANGSAQVQQFKALQSAANQGLPTRQMKAAQQGLTATVQRKENKTGLPDQLKSGVEGLSGMAMDDVKVHYNSDKPAQMQAHAYAQGTDIHVAPGQEQHLPHEAWHVVQQKQGRVQATTQLTGKVAVTDDAGLEHEADVMGAKAMQMKAVEGDLTEKNVAGSVAQRVENEEAQANEAEGLDPEIMEVADMLEAEGEDVTVESLEEAMEMESEGEAVGAPVQCVKPKAKIVAAKKKKRRGVKKQSKTSKYKPKKPRAKRSVTPKKKTRYGGHDSTGNKNAILEVINFREEFKEEIGLKKLSLPERTTVDTQNFGLQNVLDREHMKRGTAICHKLAESEIFKSIDTLIDDEINEGGDGSYLEDYLETLIDYISPRHIAPDLCPEGGNYESEVTNKYRCALVAFTGVKNYELGSNERRLFGHELAKSVVNSPVNLFNGSSTRNSSIQEHLDGNRFQDMEDETPLTPRSERAQGVQKKYTDLIESSKKEKGKKKREMSSSLFY